MTVASQAVALVVLVAVLSLAVWGLVKVPRLVRGWRYDWARAKHLLVEVEAAPEPDRDFYGSMSLADEPDPRGYTHPMSDLAWLPAPEVAHEDDWLAQTRADLAPDALDALPAEWTEPSDDDWEPITDSGPGKAPSVDPGPDPGEHVTLCSGCLMEAHCDGTELNCDCTCGLPEDWSEPDDDDWEPIRERLADTGDIMDAALAADVAAYQRAQDDQVRAWCSGFVAERREFTRQLAEAWA
jgi:hypothetical protein